MIPLIVHGRCFAFHKYSFLETGIDIVGCVSYDQSVIKDAVGFLIKDEAFFIETWLWQFSK